MKPLEFMCLTRIEEKLYDTSVERRSDKNESRKKTLRP